MGQYKTWLHYREIDQQLHTQLTQLTTQLNALKEQAQLLDEGLSLSDNAIIQALLAQLVSPPPSEATQQTAPDIPTTSASDIPQTSPSLHGHFASFFPLPSTTLPDPLPITRPASTPHPELDLLPEDISAFVDEHTHTAPLRTPPWWLHKIPANSVAPTGSSHNFKDQQSERTNHSVQRWFERWGRSSDPSQREEE